ncbi:hypothetical protein Tsubulata_021265 [Turnera subulata]|uniref:CASP-like protein n=1 Tax=Turnera subulata TaxID=218843 RepID=A0A9Q0J353_9ROSI|nr:hypothetical protein Tsubulata_021265 [Turnera subulata]
MELSKITKVEAFLRPLAMILLVATACLVGLDTQTKYIIYYNKTVTYRDLKALWVLVYVTSIAAAYNLLQLSRCYFSARYQENLKGSRKLLAYWSCFALDQLAVYITFATTSAAMEHSILVLTGMDDFQWMKWCNRFTRFCFIIGGSLLCGYLASFLMVTLSFISAFNLFRLYSPKQFLTLKSRQ